MVMTISTPDGRILVLILLDFHLLVLDYRLPPPSSYLDRVMVLFLSLVQDYRLSHVGLSSPSCLFSSSCCLSSHILILLVFLVMLFVKWVDNIVIITRITTFDSIPRILILLLLDFCLPSACPHHQSPL